LKAGTGCLLALIATLIASGVATGATQEMKATIARDEAGEFSCANHKRIAVLVEADKDLLPNARYQYAVGGGLHILCADYAGTPPPPGRKVRVSLREGAVQLLQ